jgi:cellulose synthase/poly-beta-1,6-N-acetylglucosamine synthase-like glycosyltransferase
VTLTVLFLALTAPLFAVLLLDSLLRAWLMLVRWFTRPEGEPACVTLETGRWAALIPAHNEAGIIGATVSRLQAQSTTPGVFVIADNCTDDTARLARQAGAQVWERHAPLERSKGAALRWFGAVAAPALRDYEFLAVFDADSVVSENFWRGARAALSQGADVVQGFVQPLSSHTTAADLAAYSELLSQHVDDIARSRLGWQVPLRGTGMVFRRPVLDELLPRLQTRTEDVEMSLWLAAQGKSVRLARGAVIGDPKPAGTAGVATQRARWLQGQREVLRYHGSLVLRLLSSGRIDHLSLVFATLLKPKTLVLLLKGLWCLLIVALPLVPAGLHWLAAVLAGLAFALDGVYYVIGLRWVETPARYGRALLQAPIYLGMWLWSLVLSLVSTHPWLSVRRHP